MENHSLVMSFDPASRRPNLVAPTLAIRGFLRRAARFRGQGLGLVGLVVVPRPPEPFEE